MTRIRLVRSEETAQAVTASTRVKVASMDQRNQHWGATQLSAIILIVVAWLIGTLISELDVIGAEPSSQPIAESTQPLRSDTLLQAWNLREADLAIFHSNLQALERMQRNAKLLPGFEATIAQAESRVEVSTPTAASLPDRQVVQVDPVKATETNGTVVPKVESVAQPAQTHSPKGLAAAERTEPAAAERTEPAAASSIHVAYQSSPGGNTVAGAPASETIQAWHGIPEGAIPGLVELVVHSFQELMAPVHVRPLTTDDVAAETSEDGLPRNDRQASRSQLVGTEVDRSPLTGDSAASIVVQPASIAELAEKDSATIPRRFDDRAQIIRTVPQLLSVVENTAMAALPLGGPESGDEPTSVVQSNPDPGEANRRENRTWVPQTVKPPATSARRSDVTREIDVRAMAQTEPNEFQASPVHVRTVDPNRLEPRIAAKWPFDRTPATKTDGVSLNVDNADVRSVFEMLARGYHMNILVSPDVEGVVTANVEGMSPVETLAGIVKMCGLNMQHDGEMIFIYPSDNIPADARELRVFQLDFARAATLEPTVQGLLSPVGNAYPSTIDTTDNMQTRESIVVVDVPSAIAQIESYILQADQAPRQVMIEARVLEVELSDEMIHGINFDAFLSGDVSVSAFGLADPVVSKTNPVFYTQISGRRLSALIDLLETTTDSKTLASPRVQVLNGQNARIQVGQQLGFTVATVTQTSTIQDVQFLETGVVLSVTPTISRDGRILMQVKPEVSDGEINPQTLLPEEETREVETSVLLDNHHGVIIGGLIQEKDRTVIKKLPWLGDVKYVGKLFQRREALRSRSEIIVALIPHIVERGVLDEQSAVEWERADTPLLQGVLQRTCRPWEPRLPDRVGSERHMDVNTLNRKIP